jgi:flagellar motor protein MotB
VRLFVRVLVGIYIAYLAVVVLLLTPALNFLPSWYAREYLGREFRSDIILFNPFTVALEVRRAELPEHDGERFAELHNATVDLSMESLWEQGWVFDELSIAGLFLHIRQLADGEFNFSDMLPPSDEGPTPEPETEGDIPGLTIHQLALQAEAIRVSYENRDEPYSTALLDLDIEVDDLSTILEEGRPYRIDALGEKGGKFHWEGVVSIPGAYSEGFLLLSQVQLEPFWLFARPWLNFELRDGRLGLKGSYRVNWGETLSYAIEEAGAIVHDIDIHPIKPDSLPDTFVSLASITVSGINVDSTRQHASVAGIEVDSLAISGWMEDSQVSLADLFAVHDLPADDSPELTAEDAEVPPGWTAEITGAQLVNSSIHFRSAFTDPPLLQVEPLEASLGRINWPLSGDTDMKLSLAVNQEVSAGIDGALDLGSGNGTLAYQLEGVPLTWFNPNFPAALKAKLTDGHLATDGEVTLAGFSPDTIFNEGEILDFAGRIQDAEVALTSWETLRWEGLDVNVTERDIKLQKLYFNRYAGRLHIQEDGTVNAQKVWQEEVGEQAEQVVEELSEGKPWSFALPQIAISDSQIDFMDESLPINFRTVIGNLNGEVLGIHSDPGVQAQVDMRGTVDGYAPVVLKGTAAPMKTPPALDLDLGFTGVDLALLTPYSANYAGYKIESGVMNLDLQYLMKDSMLDGNNSLKIDHLKLGERVDSEDAVDLPLELALALLTDSNGVIEMEVPVKGNVDDPSFDVGSVVAKAFVNIITKAVTAPFKLLGSLVGSEEDLQRIQFAIGSSELDEGARTKLNQLNSALQQRPQLTLVITGQLNLEADRKRLQWQALQQQLLDEGLTEEDIRNKTKAWEKAMEQRYLAMGQTQGEGLSMAEKADAVTAATTIPDSELEELAEARAVAVKSYLVNEAGMGPDRAVIEQSAKGEAANLFSGAELSLK